MQIPVADMGAEGMAVADTRAAVAMLAAGMQAAVTSVEVGEHILAARLEAAGMPGADIRDSVP